MVGDTSGLIVAQLQLGIADGRQCLRGARVGGIDLFGRHQCAREVVLGEECRGEGGARLQVVGSQFQRFAEGDLCPFIRADVSRLPRLADIRLPELGVADKIDRIALDPSLEESDDLVGDRAGVGERTLAGYGAGRGCLSSVSTLRAVDAKGQGARHQQCST